MPDAKIKKVKLLNGSIYDIGANSSNVAYDGSDADLAGLDLTDALDAINLKANDKGNVIEKIKRNGTTLPIVAKTVDIEVPTKTSDLENDDKYVSSSDINSSKETVITSYPGVTTSIYPAANITAITGITYGTTTIYGSGTTTVYGTGTTNVFSTASVNSDKVLSFGSTSVSNGTSTTVANGAGVTVTNSVSASGSASVRDTETTLLSGLGTPVTKEVVTNLSSGIRTLTGNVVTFDNDDGKTMIKSLSEDIPPSQSFNGYDYPWPAGGGKNLFDPTLFVEQLDWYVIELTLKPNTTYTMSSNISFEKTNELPVYFKTQNIGGGTSTELVCDTHPVTMASDENGHLYISERRVSGSDVFSNYHWQIEEGSTATTFAPYSNICPISGYTEATVTHCGENVYSLTENPIEQGAISAANGQNTNTNARIRVRSRNYTAVEGGRQYKIYTNDTVKDVVVNEYGENNAFLGASSWIALPATFTMQANTKSIRLLFRIDNGTNVYPADVTVLVVTPNSITTYPVSWQTEAGTVYGGSVDVVSGVLTVTHKSVTFDGSEAWGFGSGVGGRASIAVADMKPGSWYSDANTMCDTFEKKELFIGLGVVVGNNNNTIYFAHLTDAGLVSDVAAWRAWLSSNNVTVTYPLATPLTYNLTPTAINTLLGVNNVWGDIGDVTLEIYENY